MCFLGEVIGCKYLLPQWLAAPKSDDGAEEADGQEEDGNMEQTELVLTGQGADADETLCEVSFFLSNKMHMLYDHHRW